MSDKNKELFEELGIDPSAAVEIPDKLKKFMVNKINNEIGQSLNMPAILRSGIKYSHCDVSEIEKEKILEGVSDEMRQHPTFKSLPELLDVAELCFSGSISIDAREERDAQFFVVLTTDARMGIFTWNNGVTEAQVTKLLHYLLRTGFEAHKLINRVYFADNAEMPEGLSIHATGAAVDVKVGLDGSYRVNVEMPADIVPVVGKEIGERLKSMMPGMEISADKVCETGESTCECPACEMEAIARSRFASDNGEVH